MRAILADDEPKLLQHLTQALNELWPELEIVATANNGGSALDLIQQHIPDIAFLDIRMPILSGIEVATNIPESCDIIFVTAYDEYAIAAFESNAIDYVLKPFSMERLAKTIDRVKKRRQTSPVTASLSSELIELLNNIKVNAARDSDQLSWIRASIGDETFLIHVDDVVYFESDAKYTNVVCKDNSYPIRTSLTELESKLDKEKFWRIHRNAIVNLHAVKKVKRLIDGRYQLLLDDTDTELTVSRSFASLFKQM